MYWYEGSIWQYGWVFPIIMIAFCLLMMVTMKRRCFPKRRSRQRSAAEDDLEEASDFPPRKEMTKMDAFGQMMNRMADR
jgi:hypothetical protein